MARGPFGLGCFTFRHRMRHFAEALGYWSDFLLVDRAMPFCQRCGNSNTVAAPIGPGLFCLYSEHVQLRKQLNTQWHFGWEVLL